MPSQWRLRVINGPWRVYCGVLALYNSQTLAVFQDSRPPMTPSALVGLVPEADDLVKPFRDRYDPSAASGMPAHMTLLSPFKPFNEVGETVLRDLRRCFKRTRALQQKSVIRSPRPRGRVT